MAKEKSKENKLKRLDNQFERHKQSSKYDGIIGRIMTLTNTK